MSERKTVHGPYDTDSDAMRDTAHVHQAYRVAYERGLMDRINEGLLFAALCGAGVELGAYDRRIVGWLADWEPHVVQVIIGWIERAHAGQAPAGGTADLAAFPWRVYGLPRPGDKGRPWLVNAFTTKQLAERFAERHPEYGPLTITCADDSAPGGGA